MAVPRLCAFHVCSCWTISHRVQGGERRLSRRAVPLVRRDVARLLSGGGFYMDLPPTPSALTPTRYPHFSFIPLAQDLSHKFAPSLLPPPCVGSDTNHLRSHVKRSSLRPERSSQMDTLALMYVENGKDTLLHIACRRTLTLPYTILGIR